jgi:hypothetical protein
MAKSTISSSANVQVGNVFVLNEETLSSATHTGSFKVNAAILNTAMARQRVITSEVLSDGPSAVVAGVEQGAANAATRIPSVALIAGRIVPAATVVGGINDAINVGQHVVQGNGAEAVTEGLGVGGQASGAWAGAQAGALTGMYLLGPGWGTAIGAFFGGFGGALAGAQGAKSIGAYLTGGDTPDKLGPPLTLPNDAALKPTVTTSDGSQYALVQVEGKYTWFSIQDNPALPSRYVEVVSGARAAELTGSYLQAAGFGSQLAQAQAEVARQQREALRDAFVRSEIQSANDMGPNGLPWGTPSAIGANATQTWARSPEPARALNILEVRNADGSVSRIVQEVDKASGVLLGDNTYENPEASNPNGFRLVATSDYQGGVHWTLNRETGLMEQAGTAPAAGGHPPFEDGFAPDGSPLGQAATVIHEGRAHTTVWARDAATGHYTETEITVRRDSAGNVTQSETAVRSYAADGTELQNAPPPNPIDIPVPSEQGQPLSAPRIAAETSFTSSRNTSQAEEGVTRVAAQQEPLPSITTHEQRIVPTPGGMSFAEAHRRRDEPEQISAGSLQTVGKLDASDLVRGSPLHRMHQAQEQDLMRGLGIALAQDRERFGNEPSPQRTRQSAVERTSERAQEQAPTRGEHVAAPLAHTRSPVHANPAPPVAPVHSRRFARAFSAARPTRCGSRCSSHRGGASRGGRSAGRIGPDAPADGVDGRRARTRRPGAA